MSRYEAYISDGWEEHGMANVVVVRHRPDGAADFGVFIVDLYCLGVKDAMADLGVSEADVRDMVEEQLPPDFTRAFEPACAKKLIEGALAYAESLGFSPHRDFRKARKVLSGIDASTCQRSFTFGCGGKPCYIQGPNDSEERVDRILGILEARFGPDGFDYELLDEEEDGDFDPRLELMDFLEDEPPEVPRFFHVCGLITAMLVGPRMGSPLELDWAIWGPNGRRWKDPAEAQDYHETLFAYWNELNGRLDEALAPDAPAEMSVVDLHEGDIPEGDGEAMAYAAVMMEWCAGFLKATELWPGVWAEALSRPDLAEHWEMLGWWANITDGENREQMIAAAESNPSRTLNASAKAIARAVRPASAG